VADGKEAECARKATAAKNGQRLRAKRRRRMPANPEAALAETLAAGRLQRQSENAEPIVSTADEHKSTTDETQADLAWPGVDEPEPRKESAAP
jgi:hypothetical protein